MDEPVIEDDDLPILSLRLDSPGPHTGAFVALIRSVTGATPAEARAILQAPGSELARDNRMELDALMRKLEKLGATFHTECVAN